MTKRDFNVSVGLCILLVWAAILWITSPDRSTENDHWSESGDTIMIFNNHKDTLFITWADSLWLFWVNEASTQGDSQ